MQEEKYPNTKKREYKKKNNFKIKLIFNENGENLDKIIERAFSSYCAKKSNEI